MVHENFFYSRSRTRALCCGLLLVLLGASPAVAQGGGGSLPGASGMITPPPGPAGKSVAPSPGTPPPAARGAVPNAAPPATPHTSPVPAGFREIRLGMSLSAVEAALAKDPYFDYRGPPDLSMLANPNENLIETRGYAFIDRAIFQFYDKKLYIMILMLNPREISYYTMYTTLVDKYGPSTSLSPEEVVWESPKYRLSLERPLSVKYIEMNVFDHLREAGKMKQSQLSISRDQFLSQF